jgi:hypothetical protein
MLKDTKMWDIKPSTLAQAVAHVEAGRKLYNKNSGEPRLDFRGMIEMMEESVPVCGSEQDAACLNALAKDYQKALKQFQKDYFASLAKTADPKLVKAIMEDPYAFEE